MRAHRPVHARAIQASADAKLVAVADAFDAPAQSLAATTGAEVRAATAIIESDDIDAVIIGTPTTTHYDLIHQAARAKKAIFCEKPVDLSSVRVRDCVEVVNQNGVMFLTAFNRRFDPNFANLQSRIAGGDMGMSSWSPFCRATLPAADRLHKDIWRPVS